MKSFLLFLTSLFIYSTGLGQATFSNQYDFGHSSRAQSVASIDSGFIVVGGLYGDIPNYGILAVRIDLAGDIEWSKKIDIPTSVNFSSIAALQSGDVVIAASGGTSSNEVFTIVKMSTTGSIIWSKSYDNISLFSQPTIFEASDGSLIVSAGTTKNSIIKLSPGGNVIWSQTYSFDNFNGTSSLTRSGFVETFDHGFVFSGGGGQLDSTGTSSDLYGTIGKVTPSGNLLWIKKLGIPGGNQFYTSVIELEDSTLLAMGYLIRSENKEIILSKLSSSGNVIWNKCIYKTGFKLNGNYLEMSDNGQLFLLGQEENGNQSKGIISTLDTNGQFIEAISIPDSIVKYYSAIQTPDNGLLLVGYREDNFLDMSNFLLTKLDSNYNFNCETNPYILEDSLIDFTVNTNHTELTGGNGSLVLLASSSYLPNDIYGCEVASINENMPQKFTFYPNPTNNGGCLQIPESNTIRQLVISSIDGKTVNSFDFFENDGYIQLKEKGIYLISIEFESGGVEQIRVVRE